MTRYILSRFTTPTSETYVSLDGALSAAMEADGSYRIQAIHSGSRPGAMYVVQVAGSVATITVKRGEP